MNGYRWKKKAKHFDKKLLSSALRRQIQEDQGELEATWAIQGNSRTTWGKTSKNLMLSKEFCVCKLDIW